MRKKSVKLPFASATFSDIILFATSLHLFIGLVTHILWLLRGNQTLFRYYFGYQDPLFFLLCSVLEFWLASRAWKQFSPGQSLRWAWLLIMISALCHVIGSILTQILSADSYINPLYFLSHHGSKTAQAFLLPLGSLIGGPVQMIALGGGLFLAVRLCQKLGPSRQKVIDWVILGIVVAYTLRVAYVVFQTRVGATPAPRLVEVMNWANDPLLCVLLFFAFLLRRSVAQMGWGYVSKCWGAYVVAILGTSIASMAMWASNFSLIPYPESAVLWYLWPIIFAAYALGPAYQVEAAHVAMARLDESSPKPIFWDS
jgi:hypothetical protein